MKPLLLGRDSGPRSSEEHSQQGDPAALGAARGPHPRLGELIHGGGHLRSDPGTGAVAARRRASPATGADAVSLLTTFLVVAFVIPSPLMVVGRGGRPVSPGVPALVGGCANTSRRPGRGPGRPFRIAVLLLVLASLCSVAALFLRDLHDGGGQQLQ